MKQIFPKDENVNMNLEVPRNRGFLRLKNC